MFPTNPLPAIKQGVQTNTPSVFDARSISESVNQFLKARPEANGGALLSVIMKDGINFVLATKVKGSDKFIVEAWLGKKWSQPLEVGAAGVVFF